MTSPVSVFLRDLRLRVGMTQLELARQIGYEQRYMSAVELGIKNPSQEFLTRLMTELKLGQADRLLLEEALRASNKRFSLPPEVSTATYHFCNDLWQKIERLHPAVLDAMHSMLKVEEQVAERPRFQPTRLRRRDKKETAM
jgi:transcriptional regulator with XRE-family HTH domain